MVAGHYAPGTEHAAKKVLFDASSYSPIYSNDCTTVQPPAITVNWCIQAKKTNTSSGGSGSDCDCPDEKTIKGWIDEKIKNNTGGLSIGTVFSHVSNNPPEGAKLLDGQKLAKSVYPDFYKYINDNQNNIRVISNDDYEAEIAKYKFCGAFVISDNEVRLPTLSGYIPLGNKVPVVGNNTSLGLTDGIVNEDGTVNNNGIVSIASSGLTPRDKVYGVPLPTATTDAAGSLKLNYALGVTTDPEKSGLIVDTSNYPKDGLYWYIQVYNSTYTPSNVDAAVKDLSNVTAPTQNFKDMSISWGIPDYASGVDVAANWEHEITAERNCRICYGGSSGDTSDTAIRVYINDKLIGNFVIANNGVFQQWIDIPKGSTYKITGGCDQLCKRYIIEYPFIGNN